MALVLEAKIVYPIHYGTFALGKPADVDDRTALRNAWKGDNLRILDVGEHVEWNGNEFGLL
jgi:L-ascorbate metabolism protein UlaG (beta-lactamase superfamily)